MTENSKTQPFGLEEIAKIAGLAASLSLPASFLFDWSYFDAMGISIRLVPTSLIDHAKSAVFWFPIALFAGIGWAALQMLVLRFFTQIWPERMPAIDKEIPFDRQMQAVKKGRGN